VAVVAALAALVAAGAASAHATLEETQPTNDTVVQTSPAQVTMRFSEPVETPFGSVRVYDDALERVDTGKLLRPARDTVAVSLKSGLGNGTYTVTWRVISADSHPVGGAWVFHVGAASAAGKGVAARVLLANAPTYVSALLTTARLLDFALILALAGGSICLVVVLRDLAFETRRRLLGILGGLAAGLAVVALAGIILQGAKAGGFGLWNALQWDVLHAVLETRFGQVWLAQAAAALAIVYLLLAARYPERRILEAPATAALVLSVLLVLAPAAAGHASVNGAFTFVVDVVHVEAAAAWTGALLFLLLALRLAEDRWGRAREWVPAFSALAVFSVAALLAAGVTNAYLEVRTWSGLWETTYGRLLLAKVALVLPLLALGAYNNRVSVPRLKAGTQSALVRGRFLRATAAELAIVVAIVSVTAVLVGEPPAKAFVAPTGPYATDTTIGPYELNFVVDPADTGTNQIHLYLLDRNGQPAEAAEARAIATLPSANVGPLRFQGHRAGPGHFLVQAAQLPFPGKWTLRLEVRRGKFDLYTRTVEVPIRKDS
jgi:copper transport protein